MGAIKELAIELEERGIEDVKDIRDYITGGHGTFTLLSLSSYNRFTYKIGTPENQYPYFVSVLTGPDNTSDYTFIGTIFENGDTLTYRASKKSPVGDKAQSNLALHWFLSHINANVKPASVAFYHEGRCGRCGRKLTTPESVKRGLGPHCATKEN